MNYDTFLQSKKAVAQLAGIEVSLEDIHPMLFPFQKALVQWALRKGRAALFADTGLGKALPVDTKVLTPTGYRQMGELVPGEMVVGSDGKSTLVLGVYPQGIRPSYKVTFSDGTSIHCDLEHLWPVRTKTQRYRGQSYTPMTLGEILEHGLVSQEGWRFFIPVVQPIEFENAELPLDPYLLGALIGDGGFTGPSPILTSVDEDIIERVALSLPDGIKLTSTGNYGWRLNTGSRNGHQKNAVTKALQELGLWEHRTERKFIPDIYKYASQHQREALLQGLLDTDGHVSADNNIEFCTVSPQLAKDVAFLIQSLGGIARIRTKETGYQLAYRMSVILPCNIHPFYLSRKADNYHPRQKYQPTRAIVSVEPDGESEMICIAVDAQDHCYVVEHCIVTHNTFMHLVWARLTGQRALILAPLSVARQTVGEAKKIGIDAYYTRSGNDLIDGINITNYEMLEHFNPADFGAIVLDESSILKSLDGKTKTRLIEMFDAVPYRLACTATPAPNDIAEIANHAEFLGLMRRAEMLSMFFVHDSDKGSGNGWRLKGHAYDAFYRWMASWSMSIKKPSDLGFDDTGYILPPLHVQPVIVETDYTPEGSLFYVGLKGIGDRSQARRGTLEERVQKAVELVQANTEQWILWCGMNDESSMLAHLIPDSIEITGSDSPDAKIAAIEAFQDGKYRVLITKPKIAGFGINLQNCHYMAFVGLSDSFEAYYQCIRRCYRFGQVHSVHASIILSEVEQEIYSNVMRKEEEANTMSQQLIGNVQSFEREEIEQVQQRDDYNPRTVQGKHYTLMLGDSCERMAEVADNSVDLSVFSPPFQNLYCYSPTDRDLGNSKNADEFYQHFSYIIDHLLRVIKPGRNCCVHVHQIAASLVNDGYIGLKDFRGEVIKHFIDRGFIYHGEVCIDKNPQAQAIRTKAKGLLFAQLRKDASWLRPGLADYILVFRKPGDNAIPVHPDMTNEEWIEWAHPVWYGIKESDTLNVAEGRDEKDERHVCPLQLGTIERCIKLWSNPGETVLSPFTGIGSEGYVSIGHGRQFVGIELKPSYWNAAKKNLDRAERNKAQSVLFDELTV